MMFYLGKVLLYTCQPQAPGLPWASRPIKIETSDGLSGLLYLALKRPNHLFTYLLVPVHTFRLDENTRKLVCIYEDTHCGCSHSMLPFVTAYR